MGKSLWGFFSFCILADNLAERFPCGGLAWTCYSGITQFGAVPRVSVQIPRSHSLLFSWPGKSPCPPLRERKVQKLQESPCFSAQLGNPLPPAKRGMQKSKASSAGTILNLPFTKHTELLLKAYSSQHWCGHIQDSVTLLSAPGVVWSQWQRAYYS